MEISVSIYRCCISAEEAGFDPKNIAGCTGMRVQIYQTTLTTLTFIGPDGTEYDFRDQLNGGAGTPVTAACPTPPYSRAPG
jgi:hypothetical protein